MHKSAGMLICATSAALLGSADAAYSGPCTAQIQQLEAEVSAPPGPESGPTAPQALGAQLHRQPTPSTVEHAEHVANKDADAALQRAKTADAAGDAAACNAALNEARNLYALPN